MLAVKSVPFLLSLITTSIPLISRVICISRYFILLHVVNLIGYGLKILCLETFNIRNFLPHANMVVYQQYNFKMYKLYHNHMLVTVNVVCFKRNSG